MFRDKSLSSRMHPVFQEWAEWVGGSAMQVKEMDHVTG